MAIFKSFKDFGESVLASAKEKGKQERAEKYNALIKERMRELPPGMNFYSQIPGVESITIIKPEKSGTLNVVVFYQTKEGRQKHETLSIGEKGELFGRIPADIKASKEEILDEILNSIDKMGIDFWYAEPQKILNIPDWPALPKEEEGKELKRTIASDPRRVEFLRKQPDALFGFYGQEGFLGYRGFVFRNFIVLEHPKRENAAYFIDFDQPIGEEEIKDVLEKITAKKRILEKYWKPFEGKGKWQTSQSAGVERMIHKPIDNWITQMTEALNKRNQLENRRVDL